MYRPVRLMIYTSSAVFLVLLFAAGCGRRQSGTPEPYRTIGTIERLDPAFDTLAPKDAVIEILAEGFDWSEGPVWAPQGAYLLFSDIPLNSIYKWKEGQGVSLYLKPAGFTGGHSDSREPGSNGLLLDPQGRLVMCQHGDRRMARMDAPLDKPAPKFTTLAGRYEGRRLNSPNDAVFHSSGALYFTDPPYGLPQQADDPGRELDFQGVYRLSPAGELTLLTKDLSRPNGIAFSPDEKTLYVANSDRSNLVIMAYDVLPDGAIANGRIFFDATGLAGRLPGSCDGMKVDRAGNVFATCPGGVYVFSPAGRHLGSFLTGQRTANCAFGDDGSSLYITADMYLLRVKLTTKGAGF